MQDKYPSYRFHKPSGQAVVTIDGQDYYLGKHDSPESRSEYDRLIAMWLAAGRCLPQGTNGTPDITVDQLITAYWKHATVYYVKNGRPTDEQSAIRQAFRPLHDLFGHTRAADFGPLALKAVRYKMIQADLCRSHINKSISRIKRMFAWGVENELVPSSIFHGLQAVKGLRRGRSEARESKPVKPVPDAYILAVLPHVSTQVRTMIEIQELTGMRPGEVTSMRSADLDTTGRVWAYTPMEHKTEHHDIERTIYVGPRAQELIRPFLKTELTAFLFSPAEAESQRNTIRRANRNTPMTPSQAKRKPKYNRERPPKDRYTRDSYRRAITRACELAKVPPWHPNQLRHNCATRLRKEFGLEAARVVLGHQSPAITEVYAELDRTKAATVMEKVG